MREVDVGLGEAPLSPEELEELLEGFEERILSYLRKRLGRRLDELDLVVEASLSEGGRRLSLRVDLRAAGRLIAPFSYDEVLAEAVEEAGGWLQEQLRKRRRPQGVGGGASGPRGPGGDAGGGDGAS